MKNYKNYVINLTQQYISELINRNEEINIRMFYSTFEEDKYKNDSFPTFFVPKNMAISY